MLDNARWQVGENQYPAAVLLAQVAVEMAVEVAFTRLIVRGLGPDNPLPELVPDFSFARKGTRDLWEWLTGSKITEPNNVWQAYLRHRGRRNQIAHGQDWPDEAAAQDSVAAASAFMDRMAQSLPADDGQGA